MLDLGNVVGRIEVRQNLWFPISVAPFAEKSGGFSMLDVIRPRIVVYDTGGNVMIDEAPNGEPASVPLLPILIVLVAIAMIAWAAIK